MTYEAIGELLSKDNLVRGFVYFHEGDRREYLFEHTPSNIANFIMQHPDAAKIILTDMLDNLILDTIGTFIDRCPDQNLLPQVLKPLLPLQMHGKKPQEFPIATFQEVESFYETRDRLANLDLVPSGLQQDTVSRNAIFLGKNMHQQDSDTSIIRLVSPLNISVYDPAINETEYTSVPTEIACPYIKQINQAIDLSLVRETPIKLMDYWRGSDAVKEKVVSLKPYLDFIDGELMGVCDMVVKGELTPLELAEVKSYLSGQYSDGWGEGFEQHPIQTPDGELYIHFWNSEKFFIRTELSHHMRTHFPVKPRNRDSQR